MAPLDSIVAAARKSHFGLEPVHQWISRWLFRWAEEVDFLATIGKVVAKARTEGRFFACMPRMTVTHWLTFPYCTSGAQLEGFQSPFQKTHQKVCLDEDIFFANYWGMGTHQVLISHLNDGRGSFPRAVAASNNSHRQLALRNISYTPVRLPPAFLENPRYLRNNQSNTARTASYVVGQRTKG